MNSTSPTHSVSDSVTLDESNLPDNSQHLPRDATDHIMKDEENSLENIPNQTICFVCRKELSPTANDWVPCSSCIYSYHLYCLNPILEEKPKPGWKCPSHSKDYGKRHKNSMLLPDESINLDFFPYDIIEAHSSNTNRRTKRTPIRSIQPSRLVDVKAELMLTRSYNRRGNGGILSSLIRGNANKTVEECLSELEVQQKRLLAESLGLSENTQFHKKTARATLDRLAQFSPLFTQFMAWQRLMEVNRDIGTLTGDIDLWTTELVKRNVKDLEEDDQPPRKKQKTNTIIPRGLLIDIADSSTDRSTKLNPVAKKQQPLLAKSDDSVPFKVPSKSIQRLSTSDKPRGKPGPKPKPKPRPVSEESSTSIVEEPKRTKLKKSSDDSFASSKDVSSPKTLSLKSSKDSITTSPTPLPATNSNSSPKNKLSPDTNIQVIATAQDTPDKVFNLGTLSELPFIIGRSDPRHPSPDLKVNLSSTNNPNIRRVSHSHVKLFLRNDELVVSCLGRNGMQIGNTPVNKDDDPVPVHNKMEITVGPFTLIINLLEPKTQ